MVWSANQCSLDAAATIAVAVIGGNSLSLTFFPMSRALSYVKGGTTSKFRGVLIVILAKHKNSNLLE